ncbi:hypothetical protein [Halomonas sp. NO4]|uniref:hypothetical protein n=1 Tax=Halomonas sp. NO4 TaxID=2484813 RepID=UPI0013D6A31E|nr:hypothetical protein [Halomonas sp. NO4]
MSSILAYSRFKKRSLQGLALGVLGLSLSGCGLFEEDLSDRPYVMSCTGGNLIGLGEDPINDERTPERLAGVDIPDQAISLDFREALTQEIGFTPDRTALAGNRAVMPVSKLRGDILYRDTGEVLVSAASWGQPEYRWTTVGEVEVEHFYLTRGGELKSVEGFHIARYAYGYTEETAYKPLYRTVAAVLPPDAAYAVFRISGNTDAYEPVMGDPLPAMAGAMSYWVQPLERAHRYQPRDTSRGTPPERSLGAYVGNKSALNYGDSGSDLDRGSSLAKPHRRASDDEEVVDTATCFMRPGGTLQFQYFYDVDAEPDSEGFQPPRMGKNPYDVYYVGSEDALYDLPSDPDDFDIAGA